MDIEEDNEHEPTEAELAACALVLQVFRSSDEIAYITHALIDRVNEVDFAGEPKEAVVIRRFTELTVPTLSAGGAESSWKAAKLVQTIRERIVEDFQREMESEVQKN